MLASIYFLTVSHLQDFILVYRFPHSLRDFIYFFFKTHGGRSILSIACLKKNVRK